MTEAFLVFANDVDPAHREAYEDWHANHHVPQRLTVPGILRAQRYRRSGEVGRAYLTVYWLNAIAALADPRYRRLVERPDAPTIAMRPHLRAPVRLACRTLSEHGDIALHPVILSQDDAGGAATPEPPRTAAAWLRGRIDPEAAGHPLVRAGEARGLVAIISLDPGRPTAWAAEAARYEPI